MSEILEITKEAAKSAYENGSKKDKQLLENLLGKNIFLKKVTERILTFKDVIAELGEEDSDVIEYRKLLNANIAGHILNFQKAVMLSKALNEGWVPDWTNSSEYKYFAWFKMGDASGSGFSYFDCANWSAGSTVGSRLCFKSAELAKFAGTTFTEIYEGFMTF